MKLLTIHVEVIEHPGKRVHKFPQVTKDYARSSALAIVTVAKAYVIALTLFGAVLGAWVIRGIEDD